MLSSYQTTKPALVSGLHTRPVGLPRRWLAHLLLWASAVLSRLAARLQPAMAVAACTSEDGVHVDEVHESRVEFHAEPGASHGALFVDGEFVGWVAGVRRL